MVFLCTSGTVFAQSKLVINGAYVVLNNGNSVNPIYLVIENSDSNSISRDSGHIISENEYNLVKWNLDTFQRAYTFPFGYSTTDFLPFTYDKIDNSNLKVALSTWATDSQNSPRPASVLHMNHTGDSVSSAIDRFWSMESTDSSSAYLTFSYRGVENTTTNPTTSIFTPQYWRAAKWSAQPPGGDTGVISGVGTVTVGMLTHLGTIPYVLTRQGFPLPVELLEFTVKWKSEQQKKANVKWSTASEINSDYFDVERSEDGINFTKVARVKASGYSNQVVEYSINDDLSNDHNNLFYYRLNQMDLDGKQKYSEIRTLYRSKISEPVIQVFPNPFTDQVTVNILTNRSEEVNIHLYDAIGKMVYSGKMDVLSNKLTANNLEINNLSVGSYSLTVEFNNQLKVYKLIKF
jgi:hypothetical protein